MAQAMHQAARERPRDPIPPRIAGMAMAAIESLIRRSQPVERRLQALARGLDGTRNPVAARRHFARVLDALEGDAVAHAITGPQVSVLCFARLRAGWLLSAQPGQEAGVALERELRLAGKKGGARLSAPFLEVTPHALGRFIQRSGREEVAALNQALCDAGRHAQALLPVLCGRDMLPWLDRRGAPILLPTEGGGFVGFCRLLAGPAGRPLPVIEAATWLHGFELSEPLERLRLALADAAPPAALARALRGLATPLGGDRRAATARFAALGDPPDVQDEVQLLASPALLAMRLLNGQASPEGAWQEVTGVAALR